MFDSILTLAEEALGIVAIIAILAAVGGAIYGLWYVFTEYILPYLFAVLSSLAVIVALVVVIYKMWVDATSIGGFIFDLLKLVWFLAVIAGVVIGIVLLGGILSFGGAGSPSTSNGSPGSSKVDTKKRHTKDRTESMMRSCERCKYYEPGYGNCRFDTRNSLSGTMDPKNYICDYFEPKQ